VGPRTVLNDVGRENFRPLPGLELQPLCRSAFSQSLYRLPYPVSELYQVCVLYSVVDYLKLMSRYSRGELEFTVADLFRTSQTYVHVY
jgi:hypothetical protein